jgi:outer membrane protein assembly factor BamC
MRWLAVPVLALLLGACTAVGNALDPKIEYKSQGSLPPLEIPPDLTAPPKDSRFVVPDSGRQSATLSSYQAQRHETTVSTELLPKVENMHIEQAGTERWLVVQEPAEKLWPLIKDFWQQNGFLIKTEVPETGVMETDWAENRAKIPQGFIRETFGKVFDGLYSTSERDKFRTRLERTADGKGSEIYISHRGMEEVYTTPTGPVVGAASTAWQPRASDPGLEAEFLRRLMVRLGANKDAAQAMLAAAPAQQRAEIRKAGDGSELLQVHEPFDRAWRRVGLALDRVGFTVEDRDRQKGVYFVRYADPQAEMDRKDNDKGFLSKLFGGSDDKVKPEQYRIQVKPQQDDSQVHVLTKDGAVAQSKTAERILALLHEQLK